MTSRVRAIGVWKGRRDFSHDEIAASAPQVIEHVKSIPIIQKNILKYDVSFKVEPAATTLASALGLKDTDFTCVILVEGASHEKIREALTSPEYLAVINGALDKSTTPEDFHFFPAEFISIIDK
ncbi:hypothetical protein DFH06DRAFT_1473309 [Mycena polygramma]|nr:hypothetical protein DFH06DRAFT_1473309 [Mycena polygramma]